MAYPKPTESSINRLLAALPEAEYQRLLPELERRPMQPKDVLYEPNKAIDYVYFPNYGVGSLLAIVEGGTLVEVGTVGNEGMVGIPVFLGASSTNGMSFWQVPGEAMLMKTETLREEVKQGGALIGLLQRYTQSLFTMMAQHTACNRLHPIEARCARWLLMSHDRVIGDQFLLTQEFLSQMLGTRRASVNEVARTLKDAGAIDYQRGIITILDRPKLEKISCICYGIIRAEYDGLFG